MPAPRTPAPIEDALREHAPRDRGWRRELPSLVGDAALVLQVRGGCMQPFIAPGAGVSVQQARMYWPGDVLAVLDGETQEIKLHRCMGYVRRAGTWCVLTRPDASPELDPVTPLASVLGRMVGGDCDPRAIDVPWSTRIALSSAYFARVASALKRRTRDSARLLLDRARTNARAR